MVVQHNITAMNANRMLGVTTSAQAKSTEKLSSGYKINRAADDAAGLAISEKMRKQIRGLTQASLNAQDGISAVQTAEGALTEVHDMLQRMNELAVKSSNGTNSESDRQAIQDEIDQLVTEIDRVSTTTKFNETYLLQGDGRGSVAAATSVANVNAIGTDGSAVATGIKVELAVGSEQVSGGVTLGKVTATADKGKIDLDNLNGALRTELDKAATGDTTLTYTAAAGSDPATWTLAGTKYTAEQLKEMGLNVSGVTGDVKITKAFEQTTQDKLPAGMTITPGTPVLAKVAIGSEIKATIKADRNATTNNVDMTIDQFDATYAPKALSFDLHVGADSSSDNKISVEIKSMSAAGLGLLDAEGKLRVDGDTSKNADNAIDTIANAIAKVSTQRSALGAVQNRLEHTINNLDNVVENTTSAESQIRDTDIATEMVKYSNNNILQQAGTSMLSQANQSNQLALSLLG
ncbi:MAG: flagellin [Lachnospiraceae bacterium]